MVAGITLVVQPMSAYGVGAVYVQCRADQSSMCAAKGGDCCSFFPCVLGDRT